MEDSNMPGSDLTEIISKINDDSYFTNTDKEYILYLQDHKKDLLAGCTTQTLTADEEAKYRYRPRYFLYANRHPVNGDWIFLWLNDLKGKMDFKNKRQVHIPNWSQIERLYTDYRTLSARRKKMLEALTN